MFEFNYLRVPTFIAVLGFLLNGFSQAKEKDFVWPGGQKLAVSLSYDDGLDSQLDNAVPTLDSLKIKASFYILPNAASVNNRMEEWRELAERGHELGNHSIYHPCRRSLPEREWVPLHHDLDKYSLEQMMEELATANTFLKALDGRSERTFTIPCGDMMAGIEEEYKRKLQELFIAYKGQGVPSGFSVVWAPQEVSGGELIEYLKTVPEGISLINIIFHGVGGDYLSVSSEAHTELLSFLAANREEYHVDSYINLMKYVNVLNDGTAP